MRQYRNRFYSNADHTRCIRKERDVTKSDACVKKCRGCMPCASSLTLIVAYFSYLCACFTCSSVHIYLILHPLPANHHLCYVNDCYVCDLTFLLYIQLKWDYFVHICIVPYSSHITFFMCQEWPNYSPWATSRALTSLIQPGKYLAHFFKHHVSYCE